MYSNSTLPCEHGLEALLNGLLRMESEDAVGDLGVACELTQGYGILVRLPGKERRKVAGIKFRR